MRKRGKLVVQCVRLDSWGCYLEGGLFRTLTQRWIYSCPVLIMEYQYNWISISCLAPSVLLHSHLGLRSFLCQKLLRKTPPGVRESEAVVERKMSSPAAMVRIRVPTHACTSCPIYTGLSIPYNKVHDELLLFQRIVGSDPNRKRSHTFSRVGAKHYDRKSLSFNII